MTLGYDKTPISDKHDDNSDGAYFVSLSISLCYLNIALNLHDFSLGTLADHRQLDRSVYPSKLRPSMVAIGIIMNH